MPEFKSVLPPNRTAVELQLEETLFSKFLSARLDVTAIRDLHDIAQCPIELLPWLAWEWSVDEWNDDWSESIKRQVIADSFEVHKYKGTPYALKKALQAIGYSDVTIVDGVKRYDGSFLYNAAIDYNALPFPQFDVLLNATTHYFDGSYSYNRKIRYGVNSQAKIKAQIEKYKNKRSVLRNLIFLQNGGQLVFYTNFYDNTISHNGDYPYTFGSLNI